MTYNLRVELSEQSGFTHVRSANIEGTSWETAIHRCRARADKFLMRDAGLTGISPDDEDYRSYADELILYVLCQKGRGSKIYNRLRETVRFACCDQGMFDDVVCIVVDIGDIE